MKVFSKIPCEDDCSPFFLQITCVLVFIAKKLDLLFNSLFCGVWQHGRMLLTLVFTVSGSVEGCYQHLSSGVRQCGRMLLTLILLAGRMEECY